MLNDPTFEIIFVDERAGHNETIYGFAVLPDFSEEAAPYILGIGDNQQRKLKFEQFDREFLVSVISKRAHLGCQCLIRKGTFIGNFCHVGPEARIGENTIINTRAIVEHEVCIGNHCHIAPGSVVCGRSSIGDLVFLGAGAVVIDGVNICSKVTIGAGAVVIGNIEEPGIYVGIPAKRKTESKCTI